MIRVSGLVIWLTVLWLLLWGDVSVANVLSGLAVSVAILVLARLPRVVTRGDDTARVHPLWTLWFIGYVFVKLVESTFLLAWEILTPTNDINTGVVAVPLRTESRIAMMVTANVITLTPGTMTIDAVGSPTVLYVNVLHLADIDEVRRDLLKIEELSVRAFGSRRARAQLGAELAQ